MSDADIHEEIIQLLPPYFTGCLSDTDRNRVAAHLESCDACRSRFEIEQQLFETAARDGLGRLLESHPSAEELDDYTFAPGSLPESVRADITEHLTACRICREASEALARLPERIDTANAPVLADLESLVSRLSPVAPPARKGALVTRLWSGRMRSLMGLAAAAVIILAVAWQWGGIGRPEMARVDVTLGPATRSNSARVILRSTTPKCKARMRIYVGPEPGHDYAVRLLPSQGDSALLSLHDGIDCDPMGFLAFSLVLDTGQYRIEISDVEDTDTVTTISRFEIELSR